MRRVRIKRVIVVYAYVDTLDFLVSVSKSVMSINELSFVSFKLVCPKL